MSNPIQIERLDNFFERCKNILSLKSLEECKMNPEIFVRFITPNLERYRNNIKHLSIRFNIFDKDLGQINLSSLEHIILPFIETNNVIPLDVFIYMTKHPRYVLNAASIRLKTRIEALRENDLIQNIRYFNLDTNQEEYHDQVTLQIPSDHMPRVKELLGKEFDFLM